MGLIFVKHFFISDCYFLCWRGMVKVLEFLFWIHYEPSFSYCLVIIPYIFWWLVWLQTLLFFQLRTCRKCFIALAVGVWCWMAYRYRDVQELNHRILMHVQQQNAEIKALIQTRMSFDVLLYILSLSFSGRKGIRAVKNWVVRCWHLNLSGARFKWFAYGPVDATATLSSLASVKSRWFSFLVLAYRGFPGKKAIKWI